MSDTYYFKDLTSEELQKFHRIIETLPELAKPQLGAQLAIKYVIRKAHDTKSLFPNETSERYDDLHQWIRFICNVWKKEHHLNWD